jgi:hypothetical protein
MKTKWSTAAWLVVTTSLVVSAASPAGVSPMLVSSTYLGSSEGDGPNSWLKRFSVDASGTLYFAQSTYHTDFPVTANAYSQTYNGGSEQWGKEDLAVVEYNIEQNALKYASYFGGKTGPDFVTQVLRHKNSVYLAGNTGSSDLPVTSNAYDKTFNGPDFRHADGYIARFDDNKLAYLTYLGTSGADWIQSIFVNDNGEMIVVGVFKEWNELPITHKFSDEKLEHKGNACVLRFNAKGDAILSATLLGPSWYLDAVRDREGNIYVAGTTTSKSFPVSAQAYDTSHNGGTPEGLGDLFVTKLTPTGDKILFSTFLGGTMDENPPSICLDAANNIIVYASTKSSDLPVTANALRRSLAGKQDAFLAKLSNDGARLLYLSYLGGTEKVGEGAGNVVAAKNGDIYLSGSTDAADFPVTPNAIQSAVKGGIDIFVSVFDSSLTTLKFSTFLGGSANEGATIDVEESGDIVGVGATTSADFPTTPGAYSTSLKGRTDHVIFKISMTGRPGQTSHRPYLTGTGARLDRRSVARAGLATSAILLRPRPVTSQ